MKVIKMNGHLLAILIMLLIPISCANCNYNKEENNLSSSKYNELCDSSKLILLPRGIGTLRIDLPHEFNKKYKTTSIADCGCCCKSTIIGYIDTSKHKIEIPDTIINFQKNDYELETYRFSVNIKACSQCDSSLIISTNELQNHINYKRARNKNISLIKNEIIQINNKKLMVIGSISNINNRFFERIDITTLHRNERINITFDRVAPDSSDFIERMYKSLLTIEIRN